MAARRFENRRDAGRQLAEALAGYASRPDVIVLGLPRGGIPVASEVATRLGVPLDVLLVRKLGVPGQAEFAMGAIAEGGVEVLDEQLVRDLAIPHALVEQVKARERIELERRSHLYRGARPRPDVSGRTAIVVDDGLATGATMEAGVTALRRLGAARVVAAAPVGAPETCARLQRVADDVVCVRKPIDLDAVGLWYDDFGQTTDDEVRRLLATADEA